MKTYLGDGVYAEILPDGETLKLTTENGIRATNTIFLDEAAFKTLKAFVEVNKR